MNPLLDDDDDLSDEERAALHEALDRSIESLERGDFRPASAIIDELRSRR
jgi:hypothetical protein